MDGEIARRMNCLRGGRREGESEALRDEWMERGGDIRGRARQREG